MVRVVCWMTMNDLAVGAPLQGFVFSLLDPPAFKEDSVREELVLPVLNALGYTVGGPNRIIRSKQLEHPFLTVGSKRRPISFRSEFGARGTGPPRPQCARLHGWRPE